MAFELDFGIPKLLNTRMESIYTQLAAQIRNEITQGTCTEGERLSETHLCETHNVSRTPVRLAPRTLESEGTIQRGEAMRREHSHSMIKYIQTYEKRDSRFTETDLVAYSA